MALYGPGNGENLPPPPPPGEDPTWRAFDEALIAAAWGSLNAEPAGAGQSKEDGPYGDTTPGKISAATEPDSLYSTARNLSTAGGPRIGGRQPAIVPYRRVEPLPTDKAAAAEENEPGETFISIIAKQAAATLLSSARAAVSSILKRY